MQQTTTRICLLIIGALACFGVPYHFAEANSGRYLTVTLQQISPSLFPNDAVVTTMAQLYSAYYAALGKLLPSPAALFFIAPVLIALCKLSGVAAAWWAGRALDESSWLSLLLAAWAAHDKTPYFGAVSLFMPTITHHEWGMVLALLATGFILRGKLIAGYGILGLTVFVHLLVGLHFGICLLPFVWFHGRQQGWRASLIALAVFGLCSLIYVITLAPPPMNAAEAEIFFEAERTSRHFNPWARYGTLRLVLLGNLLGLTGISAFYFRARLGTRKYLCDLLLAGAALGTLAAFGGSVLAMRGMLSVAMFQPLRLFLPVAFFCFALLWWFTVKAFEKGGNEKWLGVCLAANLFFIAFEQNWGLLFSVPAVLYVAADYAQTKFSTDFFTRGVKVLITALLLVFGCAFLAGRHLPFPSLRTAMFLLPALAGLAALYASAQPRRWLGYGATAVMLYALALLTVEKRQVYAQIYDADWVAVRQWCSANTPVQARFITPPDKLNFRTLALRSSESEFTSQLAWVKPEVYQKNLAAAETARDGYVGSKSDANHLLSLAERWQCDYVITQGEITAHNGKELFHVGAYRVIQRASTTNQARTPERPL